MLGCLFIQPSDRHCNSPRQLRKWRWVGGILETIHSHWLLTSSRQNFPLGHGQGNRNPHHFTPIRRGETLEFSSWNEIFRSLNGCKTNELKHSNKRRGYCPKRRVLFFSHAVQSSLLSSFFGSCSLFPLELYFLISFHFPSFKKIRFLAKIVKQTPRNTVGRAFLILTLLNLWQSWLRTNTTFVLKLKIESKMSEYFSLKVFLKNFR